MIEVRALSDRDLGEVLRLYAAAGWVGEANRALDEVKRRGYPLVCGVPEDEAGWW